MPKPVPPMDPAHLPPVLTAPELAQLLRCSAKQVYVKCKTGEIDCVRIGRDVRIPRAVVLRMLRLPVPEPVVPPAAASEPSSQP